MTPPGEPNLVPGSSSLGWKHQRLTQEIAWSEQHHPEPGLLSGKLLCKFSCNAQRVPWQTQAQAEPLMPHTETYHPDAFKSKDSRAKKQRVGLPGCYQGQVAGIGNVLEKKNTLS